MKYEAVIKRKISMEFSDDELKNCRDNSLHFIHTMNIANDVIAMSGSTNSFIDNVRMKYSLDIPQEDFNMCPSLLFYALEGVTSCLCTKSLTVTFVPSIVEKFKKHDGEIMFMFEDDVIEDFIKNYLPDSQYKIYTLLLTEAMDEGKVELFIPLMKRIFKEIVEAVSLME